MRLWSIWRRRTPSGVAHDRLAGAFGEAAPMHPGTRSFVVEDLEAYNPNGRCTKRVVVTQTKVARRRQGEELVNDCTAVPLIESL